MKKPRILNAEIWSEADEAALQSSIADDPDEWEATDEELAQARPFAEVFPEFAASIRQNPPPLPDQKRGKLA